MTSSRMRNAACGMSGVRSIVLAGLVIFASGCNWFTDFKRQPSVKPWGEFSADSGELKGFRGQPAGSVSTHGSLAPGFAVSYAPLPATIDSFDKWLKEHDAAAGTATASGAAPAAAGAPTSR